MQEFGRRLTSWIRRLFIERRTMLEHNCSEHDGTNCANLRNQITELGCARHLMISQTIGVKGSAKKHGAKSIQRSVHPSCYSLRFSYDETRKELDAFHNLSFLTPLAKHSTTLFVQLLTRCLELHAVTDLPKRSGTHCESSSPATLARFVLLPCINYERIYRRYALAKQPKRH